MEIIQLSRQTKYYNLQAAELLRKAFPHSYYDCAEEEIDNCLKEDKVAIAAIDGEELVGFVGAMPQYGKTGWK